jgi:hypothetical protein
MLYINKIKKKYLNTLLIFLTKGLIAILLGSDKKPNEIEVRNIAAQALSMLRLQKDDEDAQQSEEWEKANTVFNRQLNALQRSLCLSNDEIMKFDDQIIDLVIETQEECRMFVIMKFSEIANGSLKQNQYVIPPANI